MLPYIALIQLSVFLLFFVLERAFPAYQHPLPRWFTAWWLGLGFLAAGWLRLLVYWWADLPEGLISLGLAPVAEGFVFYLIYSCGNYWVHRIKHSNKYLWRYVHRFHHSTSQMETRVAFYRHPTEIFLNTLYLVILGKLVFGISVEAMLIALAIEGCLESFHHANIAIPRKLQWLGYLIQLPGMHLVHHEYGVHRFNYAPFLWDTIFRTVKIPASWNHRLGFANSDDIPGLFAFR